MIDWLSIKKVGVTNKVNQLNYNLGQLNTAYEDDDVVVEIERTMGTMNKHYYLLIKLTNEFKRQRSVWPSNSVH